MPHAVHLAFPVAGARHRGVVVASARKMRGRHEMDLLVVDVRARDGQRHRIFLVGAPPTPSARRVPESSEDDSEDDSEDAGSVETSSSVSAGSWLVGYLRCTDVANVSSSYSPVDAPVLTETPRI